MPVPQSVRSRCLSVALRARVAAVCVIGWLSVCRAAELQVLHGHVPAIVPLLSAAGRLPEAGHLRLAISLPLRNQDRLRSLLRQLHDPTSPRYRKYLSPAAFVSEFAPAQSDYDSVAAFAAAHGLKVVERYGNRMVLDVDGSVADIEQTLHVTLGLYRHPTENRMFYAPDREPSLDLTVPISHVGGLDNYSLPRPSLKRAALVRAAAGSGPGGTYLGGDFRAAYLPGVTLTGTGETVGLLQFDGYSSSDISHYESEAGLPNVRLSRVLLDNFNGHPSGTDGQLEVSLDIEMAVSMAPGLSKIIVYEAGPDGNWEDILNRMASDDLAHQLSCSWYSPGDPMDPVADGIFQEMAAQGQSFYCASGDSDAFTGLVPFPDDSPYITTVGGTTLTTTGAGGAWSAEQAWNWGGGTGSSGGVSTQYAIPDWQQGTSMAANGGSTTMRNTPDVAFTADNIDVRAMNADYSVGGTSCAAPLWAALTALINEDAAQNGLGPVGFVNPAVYALGSSSSYSATFHDTTTGNNTSSTSPDEFYAVPGYDLCTGMGTPNGQALISALALGADDLQVSFASLIATGSPGGSMNPGSVSFTLVNGGSSPLNWSASTSQAWLSLSATGGTLSASGSTTVKASLNTNAEALASGTYAGSISFTDLGTAYTQTRPAGITLMPSPVIVSGTQAAVLSGSSFTYQILATNSPATYGAAGLPAGLTVSATSGLITGTVSTPGTSDVTLSAANIGGTGTATLALTVETPYQAWQNAVFNGAELSDTGVSGLMAAPAGDGIPNLMKYALNLNPFVNGAGGLPVSAVLATGSGTYLTLTYTQVPGATDITYVPQVSTDLQTWNSGPGYVTAIGAVNNPDGITESVTVESNTVLSGTAPAQFMRLEVTMP